MLFRSDAPITADGATVEMDLAIRPGAAKSFGVRLRGAKNGKRAAELRVQEDSLHFAGRKIPLGKSAGPLRLFLDRSVLEVFLPTGECLTAVVVGEPADEGVEIFSEGGDALVDKVEIWRVGSIWPAPH